MSVDAAYLALKAKYEELGTASSLPTREVIIQDVYSNITGDGIIDGIGGKTYLVQKLIPGIKYTLRFDLERREYNPSIGSYQWVSKANNLAVSAVHGTPLTTSEVSNNFFLSGVDASGNQDILFRTTNAMNEVEPTNNDITLTTTGFTRNDTGSYLPTLTSGIGGFTSKARFYSLDGTGQPTSGTLVAPSPHAYDAYMMIFPNATVANTNADLTRAFLNFEYVRAKPLEDINSAQNGIIKFVDVNRVPDTYQQLTLTDISISATDLFNKYGNLIKDDQYIVAFMLYDKNSQYIPYYTDDSLANPRQIKWFRFLMQAAGNWEIYLSQFRSVTNVHSNLHSSTSVAINIDGISTVGTPASGDEYRITIRASPY